ncbi:MAG: flippase-like domain-containing protein, partial [Armatimonadetes bacterium]|nr:flippase-like domain-containing protein [Armatimonadota bacterium]
MSRAEIVRNLLRAFATLLVLGLIFTLVNPQAVWETLRNADPLLVGVACALFLAACFISAGVWILMLRAVGCSTGVVNACSLNLVGFFFNSLIPSGLGGDVWRAWAFARQEEARPENRWRRATLGMSLATVLAERWVAFVALATLTVLTLPFALPMVEDLRLPLAMFGSVPARA